jgi:hypothetical protein
MQRVIWRMYGKEGGGKSKRRRAFPGKGEGRFLAQALLVSVLIHEGFRV